MDTPENEFQACMIELLKKPDAEQVTRAVRFLESMPTTTQALAALAYACSDPDALHEVRAYLRGRRSLNWHGYRCEIVPSAYDMERAAASKN